MATQITHTGERTGERTGVAQYDFSELSVLHIDEDKHVRDVVRVILTRLGVRIITSVENAEFAMARMQHHTTDLVLFGQPSCGQNGVRFTHTLRRSDNVLDSLVPIILVSSRVAFSRSIPVRDEGMVEFFGSPISAEALYSRIARIIDNQRNPVQPLTYFGSMSQHAHSSFRQSMTHTS